ncbi:MAG: endonuclease V [Myxococcota bacterium]
MCPIALLDAQYDDASQSGHVACLVADAWTSPDSRNEHVLSLKDVKPYRPGHFFERELPGLLQVLALVQHPLEAIIVDGYVDLDEHGHPGLGAHLYEALSGGVPVIGIAKRPYQRSTFAEPVLRGDSQNPLFVTARGIPSIEAAERVKHMHGEHRIPTLAKRVDHLARGLALPRPPT